MPFQKVFKSSPRSASAIPNFYSHNNCRLSCNTFQFSSWQSPFLIPNLANESVQPLCSRPSLTRLSRFMSFCFCSSLFFSVLMSPSSCCPFEALSQVINVHWPYTFCQFFQKNFAILQNKRCKRMQHWCASPCWMLYERSLKFSGQLSCLRFLKVLWREF